MALSPKQSILCLFVFLTVGESTGIAYFLLVILGTPVIPLITHSKLYGTVKLYAYARCVTAKPFRVYTIPTICKTLGKTSRQPLGKSYRPIRQPLGVLFIILSHIHAALGWQPLAIGLQSAGKPSYTSRPQGRGGVVHSAPI